MKLRGVAILLALASNCIAGAPQWSCPAPPCRQPVFYVPLSMSADSDHESHMMQVWDSSVDGLLHFRFSDTAGARWTPDQVVFPYPAAPETYVLQSPRVAFRSGHSWALTWVLRKPATPSGGAVMGCATDDDGLTWSEPKVIGGNYPISSQFLAADSAGSTVVVWTGFAGGFGPTSFAARSNDGGKTYSAAELLSSPDGLPYDAQVVTTGIGHFLIVCTLGGEVSFRSSDGGASWNGPFPLPFSWNGNGVLASNSANVVIAGGALLTDPAISRFEVSLTRSLDGGETWSEEKHQVRFDSTYGVSFLVRWIDENRWALMASSEDNVRIFESGDDAGHWHSVSHPDFGAVHAGYIYTAALTGCKKSISAIAQVNGGDFGSWPTFLSTLKSRFPQASLSADWARALTPVCSATSCTIDASLRIRNSGKSVGSFTVRFYLSDDLALDSADREIGSTEIAELRSASATADVSLVADAPVSGKYVIAVLDSDFKFLQSHSSENLLTSPALP